MTPNQMQKIVDGAPNDATDIDHTGAYWKDDLMMVGSVLCLAHGNHTLQKIMKK